MLPILMYHALWPDLPEEALRRHWEQDTQLRDPGARRYALGAAAFRAQLAAMRQADWTALGDWNGISNAINSSQKILLTFDDGHLSNFELALPALQASGLPAAFFITTDWIGQPGFMNAEHLRMLRGAGMMLGSHGKSHAYFSDLTETQLRAELAESKQKLEDILGEAITALALPGGRDHPHLRDVAYELGYLYILTSRLAPAGPGDALNDLPRIAIQNTQPPEFLARILAGDYSEIERQARAAGWRNAAKRLMGNKLYDKLRGMMIRN